LLYVLNIPIVITLSEHSYLQNCASEVTKWKREQSR